MLSDWRRKVLGLPATGPLSEQAVRAAYWRLVGARDGADLERAQAAKRGLLFDLGVRPPAPRGRRKDG